MSTPEAPVDPADAGAGPPWQRLSRRKLLLEPLKAFGAALVPAVVTLLAAGNVGFSLLVLVAAVGVAALAGLVPYLTTRYRITATHFEVRTGWLNHRVSTAALTRIRSVDLEATLPYRVLAMTKVTARTGVDSEQVTLDALEGPVAEELRTRLLTRGAQPVETGESVEPVTPRSDGVVEVASWVPGWARFAPAHLAGLVALGAAVGGLVGFLAQLPGVDEAEMAAVWDWVTQFAVLTVLVALVVFTVVGWLVVSLALYVAEWFGFRLWREAGSLRLTRGLLTTRSLDLEEQRIRGVLVSEPVVVRLLGGAELRVHSSGEGNTDAQVLPTAPLTVVTDVAAAVLGDAEPLRVSLVAHPPAARRRRLLRGLAPALGLLVLGVLVTNGWLPGSAGVWLHEHLTVPLLVALLLLATVWGAAAGLMAHHHLGHAVTAGHLVRSGGIFTRRREVLEVAGIIGWVLKQSVFQRRLGLATLVATTAAGSGELVVPDLALADAHALMAATTPTLVAPHLVG